VNQGDDIRIILKHRGPWKVPPPRGRHRKDRPSQAVWPTHDTDAGITCKVDPGFLEHARREACGITPAVRSLLLAALTQYGYAAQDQQAHRRRFGDNERIAFDGVPCVQ